MQWVEISKVWGHGSKVITHADQWHVLCPQEVFHPHLFWSTIPLLQCCFGDEVISRWLLTLMGQLVAQPRSCSLSFVILKSKTHIFHINTSQKVSPVSCTLQLGSVLICLIQTPVRAMERFPVGAVVWPGSGGFTASLGSLYSQARENTQLVTVRPYTHRQQLRQQSLVPSKALKPPELYPLSALSWGFFITHYFVRSLQDWEACGWLHFLFPDIKKRWWETRPLNWSLVFTVGKALLLQQVCSAIPKSVCQGDDKVLGES